MNWIVSISEQERNTSALSPSTLQAAKAAIHENGCVLLRGVFDPSVIDQLRTQFNAEWGRSEPEMATAELFKPQSARVAMCPPQANTLVPSAVAVKVTMILVLLLPA